MERPVGHPFDTIKVRLQTTGKDQFKGPLNCLLQTLRKEGFSALYKGATPPLVGWMFMDSVMLGSLTFYRHLLKDNVFNNPTFRAVTRASSSPSSSTASHDVETILPAVGHGIAGTMAGCTVSFLAAPVEHVKARLQIQYAADKSQRLYKGPLDCSKRIYQAHGIRGIYRGLGATIFFRSFFFFWWGSYDILTRYLSASTTLSTPAVNFWAGGLSAQVYWLTAYPADVVKQRIMTDPMGGASNDGQRKYGRWKDAARDIMVKDGVRGYWRGFVPCILRAFPANAMALVAFEGVMRALPE